MNQHEGGTTIGTPGSNRNFASFDTTVYSTPEPQRLQSPALMDLSASIFKAYVEAEGYLLKGLGSILSTEATGTGLTFDITTQTASKTNVVFNSGSDSEFIESSIQNGREK